MIDDFKQRFTLGDDFVVVADSGLMNKNNVRLLQQAGYKYILGARIKNENSTVKQWILSLAFNLRFLSIHNVNILLSNYFFLFTDISYKHTINIITDSHQE